MARRALLRGRFREEGWIRPPGASSGGTGRRPLHELCTRCGACERACPEGIVRSDAEGLPFLDLGIAGCTFCGACRQACVPGALLAEDTWPWRPTVGARCLSVNGVYCRACEDRCPEHAIRFRLMTGGRAMPEVDLDACSGCGGCVSACFETAVTMTPHPSTA